MTFKPVPFTRVTLEDAFWAPRIRVNREQSIPHGYKMCQEVGHIDAFRLNWKPGMEKMPHVFWDSDLAKWVEAASYSQAANPDPSIGEKLDEVANLIASAQQPDGYLNTHFTVVEPKKRFTNLRDLHELYCAGHLIEAAVAHYQATGKKTLLDTLCRYADYIGSVFGKEPGKKRGYCGHEEIELALVKLYRVTGEERYLKLSQYFVEERGRQPYYYDIESKERGEEPNSGNYSYFQAHKPVREQLEAVGHAVRAMYLYSAMADLACELGDDSLRAACEKLWESACTKRMYITGGVGATRHGEAFSFDYDLPNESAYAETCAAIGLVFWNHRMLQFDCDSRYADVLERALYNGVISGVSLDGKKFFYENPLASLGNHHRVEWFGCACCPPNMMRLLASLGEYFYSVSGNDVAVHLYARGKAEVEVGGQKVLLAQETDYPWDGRISLRVEMSEPLAFAIRLRIPGWSRAAGAKINGDPVDFSGKLEKGYARLEREWRDGDIIELDLPMPIERVRAHPDIRQDFGMVALQRGPIVFCLEQVDNAAPLHRIVLPDDAPLEAHFDKDLLGGVAVITGKALTADNSDWKGALYSPSEVKMLPCDVTAIPYYSWDHRQPGPMAVWIRSVVGIS